VPLLTLPQAQFVLMSANSALLAYAFGHADLSATTFAHAPVAARLREAHSLEADDLVRELGAAYAERHRRKTRHAAFRKLRDALR
jgi:hypothetical protein